VADEVRIVVATDEDLLPARAEGRALALQLGFSRTDATLIATAISEIARNIVVHVGKGEIIMKPVREGTRYGVVVIATDSGPGILDLEAALEHGYASRGGLGMGLPGARRLMDDFDVQSERGRGTTVTMTKWRLRDELELLRERRRLLRGSDPQNEGSDGRGP
jgi:serine/threonine-protein kinase RsbT